jgi:hypothetical protein
MTVLSNAHDLNLRSEFGDYSATFRPLSPAQIEITRAFRLPVQVIAPEHFPSFANFARQIDDAERQRITLTHTATSAAAQP